MKIHSDENGRHIRLTRVEKELLRALPRGDSPRTGHRREALKQLVSQAFPSPKEAAEQVLGFFDETMDAEHWFSLNDVEPGQAAMLLCQFDPNEMPLEMAQRAKNDVIGTGDLLRLYQRFEDVAKSEPQHRSLLDWLLVARALKLRYHPWIEQYAKAAGLKPAPPASAERWTPKLLEELRVYRTKHGTKSAAAHFGVSETRVRALLPSEKPQSKGYSAFTQRLK